MSKIPAPKSLAFAGIVVLALALSLGSLSALGTDGTTVGLLFDNESAIGEFVADNTGITVGNDQVYDGGGVSPGNDDGGPDPGNDGKDPNPGNDGKDPGPDNDSDCVGNDGCSQSRSLPLGQLWAPISSVPT